VAVMTRLERVPLHRIQVEAARIDFGRMLLTALAALLYLLGWLPARAVAALGWAIAAVKVGWAEGRRRPAGSG
jgi:hypothetical protein